jgi:hypothetical protein
MTEHKPLPVSDYTLQNETAVSLVNENEKREEMLLRIMDKYAENSDIDKR